MTEIVHMRCDRCGEDTVSEVGYIEGWALCRVNLKRHDFCPACWKAIMQWIDSERVRS
jgi:hypothetical protein